MKIPSKQGLAVFERLHLRSIGLRARSKLYLFFSQLIAHQHCGGVSWGDCYAAQRLDLSAI